MKGIVHSDGAKCSELVLAYYFGLAAIVIIPDWRQTSQINHLSVPAHS